MTRRLAFSAMGIALANLAALGLMIGLVGASRAYSVGVQTLFRDHLPAVAITLLAAALASLLLGRTLHTAGELAASVGLAVAADVLAALAVTASFHEMARVAGFSVPRAIFTETVGGLQLVAIAGGATLGYVLGRPTPTAAAEAR